MQEPRQEEPRQEKNDHKRLYLDFDGTLTGMPGEKCVDSPLYKSLQEDSTASHRNTTFKDNMVDLLQTGLALPENKPMKMTDGAVKFLEESIRADDEVYIISNNRREYIKAMLKVSGFSDDDISNKMIIKDVKDIENPKLTRNLHNKKKVVEDCEKKRGRTKSAQGVTIICDDNRRDLQQMKEGAYVGGYAKESTTISVTTLKPSEFNFEQISQNASALAAKMTAKRATKEAEKEAEKAKNLVSSSSATHFQTPPGATGKEEPSGQQTKKKKRM